MLNKFLDRLYLLIAEYREQSLGQFTGPDGCSASFDDLIWFYRDPNSGRKTRFLCGRHGVKGKGRSGRQSKYVLNYPYNYLVKVWIIEVVNYPISFAEKAARVSAARKLLSFMEGHLYAQTESTICGKRIGVSDSSHLRPFLSFCIGKGLMPRVDIRSSEARDRTGHAEFEKRVERLPKIESIIALGSIFSKVFTSVDQNGVLSEGEKINVVDAWVVTYALAGLATPSRLSVEFTALPKQQLKSYSEVNDAKVYFLDWKGSKGYQDNKTHVLGALASELEKAINFFLIKCEPARILCRFYENPQLSLNELLGGFEVDDVRRKLNIDFDRPTNLFVLGYLLGFYEVEDSVPVLKDGVDLCGVGSRKMYKYFDKKFIYLLRLSDRLSTSLARTTSFSSFPFLFGYENISKKITDEFSGASTATIKEIQDWWIAFYKRTVLPEFPLSYTTGEPNIRLADALFCLQGDWVYGRHHGAGSGGKVLQASPYALVPLSSLGTLAAGKLKGSKLIRSVFEEHGFSKELTLQPHSLRHFGNTLADQSGIPHEIITAWSGRRNPNQTTTYIHTSHQERADRVSAIFNLPENDRREIRVIAQEDLIKLANLPATITSTGVCTQDLNSMPCDYLNDFVSQCFLCPEACHIAGDDKAISFLDKDYQYQNSRLAMVSADHRLPISLAMQRWYVVHSRNTYILSELLHLMKTSPKGSVIRFSKNKSEFYLSDLQNKLITNKLCVFPDFDRELKSLVESRDKDEVVSSNSKLQSLLSSFGLSGEGA